MQTDEQSEPRAWLRMTFDVAPTKSHISANPLDYLAGLEDLFGDGSMIRNMRVVRIGREEGLTNGNG